MIAYPVAVVPHDRLSKRIASAATEKVQHGQSRGFRASSLSTCLRQTGYKIRGIAPTEDRFNPDHAMAADQGTVIHEHLQRHMIAADLVIDYPGFGPAIELPLSVCCATEHREWLAQVGFSGHIDAVLRLTDGKLAILDVKTVASKYLDPAFPYHAEKVRSYSVQVGAYMHCFAMTDGERAHQAFVLMVSRDDTSNRLLYRITYDEAAWAVDAARLDVAAAAVQAGELPPAEVGKDCRWCGWRAQCEAERGDAAR